MKHPLLETHPAPQHIRREATAIKAEFMKLTRGDDSDFEGLLFTVLVNALRAYDSTEKDVILRNRAPDTGCPQCGSTIIGGLCTLCDTVPPPASVAGTWYEADTPDAPSVMLTPEVGVKAKAKFCDECGCRHHGQEHTP